MGRNKIEIKKMERGSSSQSTYVKRRLGLFKKARELSTLCDAEVAVILFSSTGEMNQQCSGDLMALIRKFKNSLGPNNTPADEPKEQPNMQVDVPRQEMQKHDLKKLQSLGKNLTGMDLQELHALEQKLNEGLLCIKERKEQILLEEIARCRMQEMHAMQEIENLSRQVEGFRSFFKSAYPMPVPVSYPPRMTSNVEPTEKDSNTTLCLGLPFSGGQ
ncbi:MADS box transcription factor [Handroanthus impetiginosus]|uniref:MADS box transcription factor n=1 Tax=Handroanthus impetiginosus TaxID=429701 RepID=A0A2G9I1K4_9LAMI|nr:MADS box transcription factor [Handroanthus impetiginosus]